MKTLNGFQLHQQIKSIDQTIKNYDEWSKDYWYDSRSNEFTLKQKLEQEIDVHSWFDPSAWNEKILMYQLT